MILKSPTQRKIEALKPADKRYSVSLGFGLSVRVHPTGLKSWVLRQSFNGRVTDIYLGHLPDVSYGEAKQKARKLRKAAGQEPPRGYTLRDAFLLWCNLKRGRIVSYPDERRRLKTYIIKPLGSKQIDEITPPLIIQTVKHIEDEGHQATLKRVILLANQVLETGVNAGYLQHNSSHKVSKVFAPPIVTPRPAIKWQELTEAMRIMNGVTRSEQLLFLWSLCTLLRPGENVCIRKSWIKDDVIDMPAKVMKNRKPFRVIFLPLMRVLLGEIKAVSSHPRADYIFTGRKSGKHLNSQALAKCMRETLLADRLVPHGIRSVGRTFLADKGMPFIEGEACLAHFVGTSSSKPYLRSDYLEARRPWMAQWCSYVVQCARRAGFLTDIIDKTDI